MRFLVDECTGPAVARWLHNAGHDVYSVFDEASGISDDEVLGMALRSRSILITNDKDFGEMIFRERREHCGVVFLRLDDERSANKIDVLRKLIEQYIEKIPGKFVTVTETRVRFA